MAGKKLDFEQSMARLEEIDALAAEIYQTVVTPDMSQREAAEALYA